MIELYGNRTAVYLRILQYKMAANDGDVILDELTCSICYELYTKPKTVTPCMHTFCEKCLQDYVTTKQSEGVNNSEITCPFCRDPIQDISSIKTNCTLANMIESLLKYCAKCTKQQQRADSYCRQCNIHLCGFCARYHEDSNDYLDHTLIRLVPSSAPPSDVMYSSSPNMSTANMCFKHDEKLSLYCKSCMEVVCSVCVVLSHQECSSKHFINEELVTQVRTSLQEQLEVLRNTLKDVEIHHETLMKTLRGFTDRQQEKLTHIRSVADQMKTNIDQSVSKLEAKISTVYDNKLSPLKDQILIINKLKDRIGVALMTNVEPLPWLRLLERKRQLSEEVETLQKEIAETLQLKISEGSETDLEFLPSTSLQSVGHLIEEIASYHGNIPSAIEQGRGQRLVLQSQNKQGIDIEYGGADIKPQISHTHNPTSSLPCEVFDSNNGSYEIWYTPTHHTPLTIQLPPNYRLELPVVRSYTPLVPTPLEYPITSAPYGVCILPGNRLAISTYDKKVIIIDIATGDVLHEILSNFVRPYLMAIDKHSLWVTDREGHNIQRFSLDNYRKLLHYGTRGNQLGQFQHPRGLAIHPTTGHLYVADMKSHRIQVLKETESGLVPVTSFGTKGNGECEFNQPAGLLFNQHDQLVVCDDQNCRLQVLTGEGQYVTSHGMTRGERGILCSPIGLTQDCYGRYIVGEFGSHLVTVLSNEGTLLSCVRTLGDDIGSLSHPRGVAVDIDNYIYVADFGNQRVVRM